MCNLQETIVWRKKSLVSLKNKSKSNPNERDIRKEKKIEKSIS
jgi:hypothetical protein